jgi:hypothetical protein
VSTLPIDVLVVLIPAPPPAVELGELAELDAAAAPDDGLLALPEPLAALLPHAARKTTAAAAPDAAHHRVRIALSPFVMMQNLLHT